MSKCRSGSGECENKIESEIEGAAKEIDSLDSWPESIRRLFCKAR